MNTNPHILTPYAIIIFGIVLQKFTEEIPQLISYCFWHETSREFMNLYLEVNVPQRNF